MILNVNFGVFFASDSLKILHNVSGDSIEGGLEVPDFQPRVSHLHSYLIILNLYLESLVPVALFTILLCLILFVMFVLLCGSNFWLI